MAKAKAKTKKDEGKLTPFSFVNEINTSKRDIMRDQNGEHSDLLEKVYSAWLVNRSLSYFNDSIIHANEMNKNHHLDSRLQFDYLRTAVRRRKRYSKWIKNNESESIEIIKTAYQYSNEKARMVLDILSDDQLNLLKQKISKGGHKK